MPESIRSAQISILYLEANQNAFSQCSGSVKHHDGRGGVMENAPLMRGSEKTAHHEGSISYRASMDEENRIICKNRKKPVKAHAEELEKGGFLR